MSAGCELEYILSMTSVNLILSDILLIILINFIGVNGVFVCI